MAGGFVLGSARCGSTLVSDILRLHPGILSLSEVFSTAGPNAFPGGRISAARFWRGLARPTRFASAIANPTRAPQEFLYGRQGTQRHDAFFCPPILQVSLPHLSDDADSLFDWLAAQVLRQPRQSAALHYRGMFDALSAHHGRQTWVERSGGSIAAARTLHSMFPGSRFLLLTRSGPDTALSMRDYPAARVAVWMWRRLGGFGIDLLSPDNHYGRGRLWRWLQASGGVFPLERILDTAPDAAEVGAFWSHMMIRGTEAMSGIPPDRIAHLSYEDLVADPVGKLRDLGLFLADYAPRSWLDRTTTLPQKRPSRADRLPDAERRALFAACLPGQRALDHFIASRHLA